MPEGAFMRGRVARRLRAFSHANRYGLVILLIAIAYVLSLGAGTATSAPAVMVVQLAVIWLIFSVSESPRARRVAGLGLGIGLVVALVAVLLGRATTAIDHGIFVLITLLYAVAPVVIVRHIFSRRGVDLQTLLGAVAAYLLIGMSFAYAFRAVGAISGTPLFGAQGSGTMDQDLFFSFVTLTTTGYGNLVPVGQPGESLAILEAIIGQLFLVTAVAKIVTDWRTKPDLAAEEDRQREVAASEP